MKRSGATLAVVRERLRRERSAALAFMALCAAGAFVTRFEDAYAHVAGALIFVSLAACAAALVMRSQRNRELLVLEAAAPVFGRELARAHAIAACVLSTAGLAAYWTVCAIYGTFDLHAFALSAMCGYAVCLILLYARVAGVRATLAAAAACAALCAFAFVFSREWIPAAAACAAAGFLALRQYGEVLARG